MAIDLGDVVTLEFPVLTAALAYANAATITLTIVLPDGTTVSPAVANPPTELGRYRYDYPTVQPGRHLVRWTSTNPATAYTDTFDVRPAAPPLVVSLADAKKHINKSAEDTSDDEELRGFIEAATAVIEEHRAEVVVRRTVVEDMQVCRALVVQLTTSPVQSLTSVATVDGTTTWDVADLHVSRHGVVAVQSGPALHGLVRFTMVGGYTVIPGNYTLAAKIIIAHLWETQQQAGVGPRGPFGTEGDQFLSPTGRGFAIPNRAVELLGRRPPLVA